MMQNIRLLRSILNESLDSLEAAYESKSLNFPSLDEPYAPKTDGEKLATTAEIQSIIDRTVAASYQLLCTVRHPFLNLADAASGVGLFVYLNTLQVFSYLKLVSPGSLPSRGGKV